MSSGWKLKEIATASISDSRSKKPANKIERLVRKKALDKFEEQLNSEEQKRFQETELMARPARAAAGAAKPKPAAKATAKGRAAAKPTLNGKAATQTTAKATSTNTANTSRKRKSPSTSGDEPESSANEAEAGYGPSKKAKTASTAPAKPGAAKKAATSKKAAPAKKAAATKKAPVAKKAAAPKKAPTPKKAAPKKSAVAKEVINPSTKRKSDEIDREETEEPEAGPATKKPKAARGTPTPKMVLPKVSKKGPVINSAPTQRLNVYVFGEGSAGELGLGPSRKAIDVKRPRINKLLSADEVGVVQVAVGGMHCAALTHDNKIITWGVNDQGALGRNTKWEAPLVEAKEDDVNENGYKSDASSKSESGLNPLESTPAAIPSDAFPEETVFTQLACGDSVTLALTDDGHVWAWGTFRNNEGILGFDPHKLVQYTPVLVPNIKNITSITTGANHVLALDKKGAVFAWGAGQQNQLGRRIVERQHFNGLEPREFGLPKNKVVSVFSGSYHSFALTKDDKVYSWGLNSFGQTGLPSLAGEDEANIQKATLVKALSGQNITQIAAGAMHSYGVTAEGACLSWGRVDGCQSGHDIAGLPEDDVIRDAGGKVRILVTPTPVPGIDGHVLSVDSGPDHGIAITDKGRAWSWGFSANYQTGQGTTEDIHVPTLIDNTATRDQKLVHVGCGGQFSVLASEAKGKGVVNGFKA